MEQGASINSDRPAAEMSSTMEDTPQRRKNCILLMGETGSGKSTLVNYLTNYFYGGSPEKLKIAIPTKHYPSTEGLPHHEKDIEDSAKSKTEQPSLYEFVDESGHYVCIDTPGLSNTSGTDQDTDNILKIVDIAENTGSITAIVLVVNGTVTRATVNLRNTITQLKGAVPDLPQDNLLVVLTNCSKATANFDLKQLDPWTAPRENIFYMNNSALNTFVSDWMEDEDLMEEVSQNWKKSMRSVKQLLTRINELGVVASDTFKTIHHQRDEIKAELNKHISNIEQINKLRNGLRDLQEKNEAAIENVDLYSDYKRSKTVGLSESDHTEFYTVICEKCYKVCGHYSQTGALPPLCFCDCNKLQGCKKCGCSISSHHSMIGRKPETFEAVLNAIKADPEMYTKMTTDFQDQKSDFENDIQLLEWSLDKNMKKIQDYCGILKTICSKQNFKEELKNTYSTIKAYTYDITYDRDRQEAVNRYRDFVDFVSNLYASYKI